MTPQSLRWVGGSSLCSHDIWGQTAPQLSPRCTKSPRLLFPLCYNLCLQLITVFIQLVLEKIPNSRSQKSCPNLRPKCTTNKAGISVIPITLIERLKENGECQWTQAEPTFQVATHTHTHTHTSKVQRWKGRKQGGIITGEMCIKRKAVHWYFVCLFFSLVESQSFLLLAWNQVSFVISWAKTLCTFLCENIWGRSTWRIAQY